MIQGSIMRPESAPVTVTFNPPALDDAAAVSIYNFLCEIVDRFDAHYGEQICRFYAAQDAINSTHRSDIKSDAPPF